MNVRVTVELSSGTGEVTVVEECVTTAETAPTIAEMAMTRALAAATTYTREES